MRPSTNSASPTAHACRWALMKRFGVLFSAVLLLVACGDSADPQDAPPQAAAESAGADPSTPTAESEPFLTDGTRLCEDGIVVYESAECPEWIGDPDFVPELVPEDQARVDELLAEGALDMNVQLENAQVITGIYNTYPYPGIDLVICAVLQGKRDVEDMDSFAAHERNVPYITRVSETVCPGDLSYVFN